MAETIVLDPSEVAVSRTQIDITPWVSAEGIDWGDAEIAAYMADQARGSSPVDFRVPNRMITVPLVLKPMGGTSFAIARSNVQAKASLFQQEGGWLKRLTSAGSIVFADVVNATLKLSGGWAQAHKGYDVEASMVLEALPDFYEAEVTLADHVTTTATELVFTETGVRGNYPGRCRIVVDDDDADRQLGLVWGLRSRNYDAAATARLAYAAGSLTPRDVATVVSTSIRHTTIGSNWTPVLSTDIAASGMMTHVGTYRVWATVSCSANDDPELDLRLVWDVGDLTNPVQNSPARLPGVLTNNYTIDLGEIRLDKAPSGTHRWQGQIQAKAATAPGTVDIKRVFIVPVDEGYGVLRSPLNSSASFSTYTIRDEFNQTAGTLTGKTLQVGGGTWAALTNGTATTDFQVSGSGLLTRTATIEDYRGAVAGSASMTNVVVQMDFSWSGVGPTIGGDLALFARQINQNNFIAVQVTPDSGFFVLQRYTTFSGGVATYTNLGAVHVGALSADTFYTLRLYVDTAGLVAGWLVPRGGQFGEPIVVGFTTDAATGGALATGVVGLIEHYFGLTANTRTYDNFMAYPPTSDAVIHPSQSAELRSDGAYRKDSAGVSYGPVPFVTGDNPRLPPAGLEGRTCEVFLKGSRGDYARLPDTTVDDISARILYRPCWLFVP